MLSPGIGQLLDERLRALAVDDVRPAAHLSVVIGHLVIRQRREGGRASLHPVMDRVRVRPPGVKARWREGGARVNGA